MHSFTVLEDKEQKSRCWQGCAPFKESFLATSSFWLGWHSRCCSLPCRCIPPTLASVFIRLSLLCVCVSMSKFLFISTPFILYLGPNLGLPQRRQWQPAPVLLPGKSHGWRSLVGCSPWGR